MYVESIHAELFFLGNIFFNVFFLCILDVLGLFLRASSGDVCSCLVFDANWSEVPGDDGPESPTIGTETGVLGFHPCSLPCSERTYENYTIFDNVSPELS